MNGARSDGALRADPGIMAVPVSQQAASHAATYRSRVLILLFLLSLPLVNPWVRGDGVGYYAYVRALLVEHKLDFHNDWRSANQSFTRGRVDQDGEIAPTQYTATGHLDNHFAVGPSI